MTELRQMLRIANVDLDGTKPISHELTKVRGVGNNYSCMICGLLGIPRAKKSGELSDAEIERIEKAIADPLQFGAPAWMLNRRKDPESGKDGHLIGNDLKFIQETDIKMMRKMRSYKGVRHSLGLPVRGQKTKSNFRKNKGKSLGVIKKKDVKPEEKK